MKSQYHSLGQIKEMIGMLFLGTSELEERIELYLEIERYMLPQIAGPRARGGTPERGEADPQSGQIPYGPSKLKVATFKCPNCDKELEVKIK